jgi:hypothetical protein
MTLIVGGEGVGLEKDKDFSLSRELCIVVAEQGKLTTAREGEGEEDGVVREAGWKTGEGSGEPSLLLLLLLLPLPPL